MPINCLFFFIFADPVELNHRSLEFVFLAICAHLSRIDFLLFLGTGRSFLGFELALALEVEFKLSLAVCVIALLSEGTGTFVLQVLTETSFIFVRQDRH